MSAVTQENAGRMSRPRLHQGKVAPGTNTSSRTNFLDLSNADVSKQLKHGQKQKQDDEVESSYCTKHDTADCDPDKDSIFSSKFVPSTSFNDLVACIRSTKLSQRHYKMLNCSRPLPDFWTVEERLEPISHDYSNPGPLKNLPEIPDWEDLEIPNLDDP